MALRRLLRQPGLSCTAIIVLAGVIGWTTATFGIVNAVLSWQPAVAAPGQLRYVYGQTRLGPSPLSWDEYLLLRALPVFQRTMGYRRDRAEVRSPGITSTLTGEAITHEYFAVLGVTPPLGRQFSQAECEGTSETNVVMISDNLWRTRFGADPHVLGTTVEIEREPFVVIGVTAREFKGMLGPWTRSEYWVPIMQRATQIARRRGAPPTRAASVVMVGRLDPGTSDVQANTLVSEWGRSIRGEAGTSTDRRTTIARSPDTRLPFDSGGRIVPARLAAAVVAVAFGVLLIGCCNLAGVFAARAASRQTETAVRVALGAGRLRVARPLLLEAVLLSASAGSAALVIARAASRAFVAIIPDRLGGQPVAFDVALDARVLGFTAVVTVLVALFVGLAPAFQASRVTLLPALADGGVATRRGVSRVLRGVVLAQVCLSVVLVALAATLVRAQLRLAGRETGFVANGRVFVRTDLRLPLLEGSQEKQSQTIARRQEEFRRRLVVGASQVRNVQAVSMASALPWDSMHGWFMVRAGTRDVEHRWLPRTDVTPGYFAVMGVRLLRGRDFDDHDTARSRPVAIVSESAARLLWPGAEPVGQRIAEHEPDSSFQPRWYDIVGVVGDVLPPALDPDANPTVYLCLGQGSLPPTLVARYSGNAALVLRELQDAVFRADIDATTSRGAGTVSAALAEISFPRRTAAMILTLAALIGLLLASVGIYGVVSFSATQRLREMGIRSALGASAGTIVLHLLRQGALLAGAGVAVGLVVFWSAARLVSATVVPIPAVTPGTLAAVVLVVAAVTGLACYLPARRTASTDPVVALRRL